MEYTWLCEYYGENCMIRREYVQAHTRQDALKKFRGLGRYVVEMICCERIDKW